MRVLLVINSLGGGGAERVMSWLANQLAEDGHSVHLLIRSEKNTDVDQVDQAVTVLRHIPRNTQLVASPAPSRSRKRQRRLLDRARRVSDNISFTVAVRKTALKTDADAVLSFIDVMNVKVAVAMLATKKRVVLSERVDPVFHQLGRFEFLRPILYRQASCVVVQSGSIASRISRDWGIHDVRVIGNPSPQVQQRPKSADERPLRVLAVGRLYDQKNHVSLIAAWSKLGASRAGWQLHVCGDGPERERIEQMITALGLEESVLLRRRVDDIANEYNNARIFVLPSKYEGFPNALIEAMAWGCAPLATDCPGSSGEILQEGRAGVLVPTDDVDALTDALRRLMDDPELTATYSARAMDRVKDFSESSVYANWLDALNS